MVSPTRLSTEQAPKKGMTMAAVAERFGADGTNPDGDYGVRLNRVLNM